MRSVAAVLAAALLAWCGGVFAQAGPPSGHDVRGAGRGGVGIQIDVGEVLRRLPGLFGPRDAEPPVYAANQVVVAWDAQVPTALEALAAAVEARVLQQARLEALGLGIAVLELPGDRLEPALRTLQAREPALVVDRHALLYPQQHAPVESLPRQFAKALIGAPPVVAALPRPVRIGVIDGQSAGGPTLTVASLEQKAFVAAAVGHQHAAAVLCVLACAADTGFGGLVPGSALWVAAVLRADDRGRPVSDTFTIAQALDWLIAQRVELINVSLGSVGDAVLARVVERTLPRVRALVAAAGNGGPRQPPLQPASLPGVVAVAAVDADLRPYAHGSRGPAIAIAAPGVDVWLPVGGGRYFSGTSYAAPFVSAALAWHIAWGEPATVQTLCQRARDLPPEGRDDATGCGLLRWPAHP